MLIPFNISSESIQYLRRHKKFSLDLAIINKMISLLLLLNHEVKLYLIYDVLHYN